MCRPLWMTVKVCHCLANALLWLKHWRCKIYSDYVLIPNTISKIFIYYSSLFEWHDADFHFPFESDLSSQAWLVFAIYIFSSVCFAVLYIYEWYFIFIAFTALRIKSVLVGQRQCLHQIMDHCTHINIPQLQICLTINASCKSPLTGEG